jgi:hypothetical protein
MVHDGGARSEWSLFHSRFYHCMQLEVLHSSGFDDNVIV